MNKYKKSLLLFKQFAPIFLLGFILGLLSCRFLSIFPSLNKDSGVNVVNKQLRSAITPGEVDKESDSNCSIYVDVGGAVSKPGVYCLDQGDRLVKAIDMAGGFIDGAYAVKYVSRYLNLSLPIKEDQKVYIPYQNDLQCTLIPFSLEAKAEKEVLNNINSGAKKDGLEIDEDEQKDGGCVNINTASKSSLMTISGVGESMSERIINGRPYKVLEDLLNVSGIGESTFEKFKPHICI